MAAIINKIKRKFNRSNPANQSVAVTQVAVTQNNPNHQSTLKHLAKKDLALANNLVQNCLSIDIEEHILDKKISREEYQAMQNNMAELAHFIFSGEYICLRKQEQIKIQHKDDKSIQIKEKKENNNSEQSQIEEARSLKYEVTLHLALKAFNIPTAQPLALISFMELSGLNPNFFVNDSQKFSFQSLKTLEDWLLLIAKFHFENNDSASLDILTPDKDIFQTKKCHVIAFQTALKGQDFSLALTHFLILSGIQIAGFTITSDFPGFWDTIPYFDKPANSKNIYDFIVNLALALKQTNDAVLKKKLEEIEKNPIKKQLDIPVLLNSGIRSLQLEDLRPLWSNQWKYRDIKGNSFCRKPFILNHHHFFPLRHRLSFDKIINLNLKDSNLIRKGYKFYLDKESPLFKLTLSSLYYSKREFRTHSLNLSKYFLKIALFENDLKNTLRTQGAKGLDEFFKGLFNNKDFSDFCKNTPKNKIYILALEVAITLQQIESVERILQLLQDEMRNDQTPCEQRNETNNVNNQNNVGVNNSYAMHIKDISRCLCLASCYDDMAIIKSLIDYGANPGFIVNINSRRKHETEKLTKELNRIAFSPIMFAAASGKIKVLEFYKNHSFNIFKANCQKDIKKPSHFDLNVCSAAALTGRIDVFEFLDQCLSKDQTFPNFFQQDIQKIPPICWTAFGEQFSAMIWLMVNTDWRLARNDSCMPVMFEMVKIFDRLKVINQEAHQHFIEARKLITYDQYVNDRFGKSGYNPIDWSLHLTKTPYSCKFRDSKIGAYLKLCSDLENNIQYIKPNEIEEYLNYGISTTLNSFYFLPYTFCNGEKGSFVANYPAAIFLAKKGSDLLSKTHYYCHEFTILQMAIMTEKSWVFAIELYKSAIQSMKERCKTQNEFEACSKGLFDHFQKLFNQFTSQSFSYDDVFSEGISAKQFRQYRQANYQLSLCLYDFPFYRNNFTLLNGDLSGSTIEDFENANSKETKETKETKVNQDHKDPKVIKDTVDNLVLTESTQSKYQKEMEYQSVPLLPQYNSGLSNSNGASNTIGPSSPKVTIPSTRETCSPTTIKK